MLDPDVAQPDNMTKHMIIDRQNKRPIFRFNLALLALV
jgi:hypothetical protein